MDLSNKNLVLYSLGWLLSVLLTFSFLTFGQSHYFSQGYKSGQNAQLSQDVSRLEKNNYNIVPVSQVTAFGGTFVSLNGSVMTMENTDRPSNPLLEEYPRYRKVTIDNNTIIVERFAKSLDQYNAEIAAARRRGAALDMMPYKEAPFDLSKIQAGQYIQVIAREPNSAYKESFTAAKLILNPSPRFIQATSGQGAKR
ncbi:hypothetical protein HY224_00195 [Candidatus Uhrbacteria bacterium]|nr:hypothetical protein [Candidatus Uhrbacteria bacterium]